LGTCTIVKCTIYDTFLTNFQKIVVKLSPLASACQPVDIQKLGKGLMYFHRYWAGIWAFHNDLSLKVVVEWLTRLLRSLEVPGWSLSPNNMSWLRYFVLFLSRSWRMPWWCVLLLSPLLFTGWYGTSRPVLCDHYWSSSNRSWSP
jgi:hypothetical protein